MLTPKVSAMGSGGGLMSSCHRSSEIGFGGAAQSDLTYERAAVKHTPLELIQDLSQRSIQGAQAAEAAQAALAAQTPERAAA